MTKSATILIVLIFCLSNASAQNWVQMGKDIDGEALRDWFGADVSMSSDGNTVAVGGPNNHENGERLGHVRVYSWSGSAWTQKGLDINGEAHGDICGRSVCMSSDGNTLVIGAPGNGGNGTHSGHARVFEWSGTSWKQKGLDIDGAARADYFGWDVSISSDGNILAASSSFSAGNESAPGYVIVYSWSGSAWTQKGSEIYGEAAGDRSGSSVCLSSDGNSIAVGAPKNDANGPDDGHVRVFTWSDSAWTQKGADIDGEAESDVSGWSVSMSSDGNTIAVGAPNNDANGDKAGHVRVYSWSGSAWTKKGSDIDGEAAGDRSGGSVYISSDGNTLAIGAPGNDGKGIDAGHVRVFSWTDTTWVQKASDIDGEAVGDSSGHVVSMSLDGNTLVIGAPGNDENGYYAGHIRVFRFGWPTGINQNVSRLTKVYPNPSTNNFTLNLGQSHQEIELKIMDVLGQLVSTNKVESASQVKFEILGNKGVYFVEIKTNDGLLTTVKVIKE